MAGLGKKEGLIDRNNITKLIEVDKYERHSKQVFKPNFEN